MYFDGTGDFLTIPGNPALAFGAGDFTIEMWINPDVISNNGIIQISQVTGGLDQNYNSLAISLQALYYGSSYSSYNIFSAGVWQHVALTRQGPTLRLFKDGVQALIIQNNTSNFTYSNVVIGGYYSTGYLFKGYLDDVRITKGVARYVSNFTPPTASF